MFTVITKSVRELCVVPHCVFLKINNARIPDERGARLHQIGPIGLRPGLHYVSVTETHQLMLYRDKTAVHSTNQTEHINKMCGQNLEFCNIKTSGT